MRERLQKVLAAAGIASRRSCEELITQGRVSVNGKTVKEMGTKVDLALDKVIFDGRMIKAPERFYYIALNKPRGVASTVSDPLANCAFVTSLANAPPVRGSPARLSASRVARIKSG